MEQRLLTQLMVPHDEEIGATLKLLFSSSRLSQQAYLSVFYLKNNNNIINSSWCQIYQRVNYKLLLYIYIPVEKSNDNIF